MKTYCTVFENITHATATARLKVKNPISIYWNSASKMKILKVWTPTLPKYNRAYNTKGKNPNTILVYFFFLFRKCGGFILWKIQVDLQTDFSKCFIIVVYPNGPQHPQLGRVFFCIQELETHRVWPNIVKLFWNQNRRRSGKKNLLKTRWEIRMKNEHYSRDRWQDPVKLLLTG